MASTAVVLLSGGLDSTTTAAIARNEGYELAALTFDYGQRHSLELECAHQVARSLGAARHHVVSIDLRAFGGSALTDDIPVPKGQDPLSAGVPITYVPARNTIFLSYALAYAEVTGSSDIFIGVNALDYSGYPDCRPEFIAAFEHLANLATVAGVGGKGIAIRAPLLELRKSEIIRVGLDLGVDYALTSSCYDPNSAGKACGECDSCQLRLAGFAEAKQIDPIEYTSTKVSM